MRASRSRDKRAFTVASLALVMFLGGHTVAAQSVGCSFPAAYPGDTASQPTLAAWMSVRATNRGIPGELPVMAALARSSLSNARLDRFGREGYFGMRHQVWADSPYRGFEEDANLQMDWFLNQVIAIRDRAILHGARHFGERTSEWGLWIALALAAGSTNSYSARLAEARALITTGCATPPPTSCNYRATYPGDDAPANEIAGWMANRAVARNIPPELPLMASLTDAGLRNLAGGDADSVGYFQMRVSIWNSGEYAGFADNPELQIEWFLDQAEAVRAARIAAGDTSFGQDPLTWGEWAADVQRPAEQLRWRYQLRLTDARTLLDLACGGSAN